MVATYPEMILWILPDAVWSYGPLAADLFTGFVDPLAESDAPGGIYMCPELYTVTSPRELLVQTQAGDAAIRTALQALSGEQALDYWMQRGSMCTGMWPLGYYRYIADRSGTFLGYGGKFELYSDRLIGSYGDKSANYSPEEFCTQYSAARLLSRRFAWIYCHGPVLWQMTPNEMKRYHGSSADTARTVDNLDDYFAVMREKPVLDNRVYAELAETVGEHGDPDYPGIPPAWWHIGPFPCGGGEFVEKYPPEQVALAHSGAIDLGALYDAYPGPDTADGKLRWERVETDTTGFVDLKKAITGQDFQLAYSVVWLENPVPRRIHIRVGSNDYMSVFVNGQLLYSYHTPRTAVRNHHIFVADLPAGRVPVMVKVGNLRRAWGFYFRITDQHHLFEEGG